MTERACDTCRVSYVPNSKKAWGGRCQRCNRTGCCVNCGVNRQIAAKGRCDTCYNYNRIHGYDR